MSLNQIHPRSLKHLHTALRGFVRGRLWLQVIAAMVFGIAVGLCLGPSMGWVDTRTAVVIGNWLGFPGQVFITVLQMIVVPLVVASVIRGLAASEDIEQLRRIGVRVASSSS